MTYGAQQVGLQSFPAVQQSSTYLSRASRLERNRSCLARNSAQQVQASAPSAVFSVDEALSGRHSSLERYTRCPSKVLGLLVCLLWSATSEQRFDRGCGCHRTMTSKQRLRA